MKIFKYLKFILWGYWRIPKGDYCYKVKKVVEPEDGSLPYLETRKCPYWGRAEGYHHQNNGYCTWLEEADWESDELSLLWDQVKECRLRHYSEKEEQKMYEECMKNREK